MEVLAVAGETDGEGIVLGLIDGMGKPLDTDGHVVDTGLEGELVAGGDEFVVLIRETRKCDLKHLFNIMNNKISIVNRDNPTWCMSTAYGVCDSNDSNVHSINDALNIADKRMYINKAEMKKQKSN